MPVRFMSVRVLNVTQVSLDCFTFEESEQQRQWTFFDGACYHTYSRFEVIELVSIGWERGARVRVKRLPKSKALGYINKLHSGGWIDDDVYHAAYSATNHLLNPVISLGEQKWEVYPYQFNDPLCGD